MNLLRGSISKKEIKISIAILILPIIFTGILIWPHFEEYVAPGDIISVNEFGIDGNVSFVYVELGITKNYYEKYITSTTYDDDQVEFQPLLEEDFLLYDDDGGYEDELNYDYDKEATIHNAVTLASEESNYRGDLSKKVEEIIDHAWEYDGDSFGLMLALGLVEEMNGEDFSNNNTYTIAGTGTMEFDKAVSSIDGVRQKLLAAEMNSVDYFFVPKDDNYYTNQTEAESVVESEGLSLQLVPVGDLDEALLFLRKLQ